LTNNLARNTHLDWLAIILGLAITVQQSHTAEINGKYDVIFEGWRGHETKTSGRLDIAIGSGERR